MKEILLKDTYNYKDFYDIKRDENYKEDYTSRKAEEHPYYNDLADFIINYKLSQKKCLEIGSSGGAFQDLVNNYYGTDIAESLKKYYHKPYRVAEKKEYPFDNSEFDVIWTINVYEHIPHLQEALFEIQRMIKKNGYVFFAPSWQSRPWAAQGYEVRPYSDFNLKGKFIKFLIPLRNSVIWRSLFIFPKRIFRNVLFLLGFKYESIKYKKLEANYEKYWVPDSDACNSIDPHDAILWFESNGFECLSHNNLMSKLLVRHGGLIFRKIED